MKVYRIFLLIVAVLLNSQAFPKTSTNVMEIVIVEQRTGKPVAHVEAVVYFWNSEPNAQRQPFLLSRDVVASYVLKTDRTGAASVLVPEPAPEFVSVVSAPIPDTPPARTPVREVLERGVLFHAPGDPSARTGTLKPTAGRLLIVSHKLTVWEQMRRELP